MFGEPEGDSGGVWDLPGGNRLLLDPCRVGASIKEGSWDSVFLAACFL